VAAADRVGDHDVSPLPTTRDPVLSRTSNRSRPSRRMWTCHALGHDPRHAFRLRRLHEREPEFDPWSMFAVGTSDDRDDARLAAAEDVDERRDQCQQEARRRRRRSMTTGCIKEAAAPGAVGWRWRALADGVVAIARQTYSVPFSTSPIVVAGLSPEASPVTGKFLPPPFEHWNV
jgi:hypothetical protein